VKSAQFKQAWDDKILRIGDACAFSRKRCMEFFSILILAMVQGIAELLPVSSSAHVIVAEKLMGLDPTSPQMITDCP